MRKQILKLKVDADLIAVAFDRESALVSEIKQAVYGTPDLLEFLDRSNPEVVVVTVSYGNREDEDDKRCSEDTTGPEL